MQHGTVLAGNYDDTGRPTGEVIPTTGAVVFDRSSEFRAEPFEFNVNDWAGGGPGFIADEEAEIQLPNEYMVSAAYPNPFNPTATVSIALPETADLKVTVYNVMGQQVAELANGQFNAGVQTFTINGSNLASGIYFVRATVLGQLDQVQKVMMVR
jgi:hypothetical protein